jgi:hypothetical protein
MMKLFQAMKIAPKGSNCRVPKSLSKGGALRIPNFEIMRYKVHQPKRRREPKFQLSEIFSSTYFWFDNFGYTIRKRRYLKTNTKKSGTKIIYSLD